jgi:hypothetical protein
MTTRSSYIYWALLVINLVIAAYFINGWLFANPAVAPIPSSLVTENPAIRSEALRLVEISADKPIVAALASSRASICVENKIVDFFKLMRSEKPEVRLFILFPASFSDQDISTFKENLSLDFDVLRMNPDLESTWEEISRDYKSEAIMIAGNKETLIASQNLSDVKQFIDSY